MSRQSLVSVVKPSAPAVHPSSSAQPLVDVLHQGGKKVGGGGDDSPVSAYVVALVELADDQREFVGHARGAQ